MLATKENLIPELLHTNSYQHFKQAKQHIPGGVNSPVRAFKAINCQPIMMQSSNGSKIIDVDGNSYIDYVGAWGPLILGHRHPIVVTAIQDAAKEGFSFGTPTIKETQLASLICKLMPNIEMLRMVNSGTEATMSALRLARGFTNRDKIIKFKGCYHGHADCLLVEAGSGALTLGIPGSNGVPKATAQDTLIAEFNDLDTVAKLFATYPNQIAAVIVEPIAGNMNMVLPSDQFLPGLRELCDQHQSILIFDEVMTGFRVSLGGAQELYNIKPDLTTLGKVIGGGLPVGAFGGRKDIMQHLAPLGNVYQAGTMSGNPLAMAAGLATLQQVQADGFYQQLENNAKKLLHGFQQYASVDISYCLAGGMFGFQFANDLNHDYFRKFYQNMLNQGIYLAPSAFEAGFISSAHTDFDIEYTVEAAKRSFS